MCSGCIVLLIGAIFVHWVWGIFGAALCVGLTLYFTSKASYDYDTIQQSWNDDYSLDLTNYGLQWAKVSLRKFGDYDKDLVKARIIELERRIRQSSDKEVRLQLYKELIAICDVFNMEKEKKSYTFKMNQVRVEPKQTKGENKNDKR